LLLLLVVATTKQELTYNEWRRDDRSCARVAYLLPQQLLLSLTLTMMLTLAPCPL